MRMGPVSSQGPHKREKGGTEPEKDVRMQAEGEKEM